MVSIKNCDCRGNESSIYCVCICRGCTENSGCIQPTLFGRKYCADCG
jgi:hypothetical protein